MPYVLPPCPPARCGVCGAPPTPAGGHYAGCPAAPKEK